MSDLRVAIEEHPDFAEIGEFHNILDRELWEHEYGGPNARDAAFCVVRDDSGTVVGTEAFIPYRMMLGGRETNTARSERSLIAPAQRGRRLFERMVEECVAAAEERGMKLAWGSTTAARAFRNAGFDFIAGHRLYLVGATGFDGALRLWPKLVRQVRAQPLRNWRNRNSGLIVLGLASLVPSVILAALLAPIRWLARLDSDIRLSDAVPDATDVNCLHSDLLGPSSVHLKHDSELWDWATIYPSRTLRVCAYDGRGTLRGYVMVQLDAPAAGQATIVDFLFANISVAIQVIGELRKTLARRCAGTLVVALNRLHPIQAHYIPAFVCCGLVPLYRGGSWVIRTINLDAETETIARDISNWYITDLWCLLWRPFPAAE